MTKSSRLHSLLQFFSLIALTLTASCSSIGVVNDMPQSHFFRTSDSIRLHYLSQGRSGSYVILLHGWGSNGDDNFVKPGIFAALAKTHRVIALDFRNHGKSDAPTPNGLGEVRDVLDLMDHLGIAKAHVHGYSMGGGVVIQLLLDHPDRLITAGLGGVGIQEIDPERINALTPDTPHPDGMFTPPLGEMYQQDFSKIQVPTIAIVGEYDRPNAKMTRLEREMPHFVGVMILERGHMDAVVEPAYAQAINQFIDEHDQRP